MSPCYIYIYKVWISIRVFLSEQIFQQGSWTLHGYFNPGMLFPSQVLYRSQIAYATPKPRNFFNQRVEVLLRTSLHRALYGPRKY